MFLKFSLCCVSVSVCMAFEEGQICVVTLSPQQLYVPRGAVSLGRTVDSIHLNLFLFLTCDGCSSPAAHRPI
ncbi:hypothetical protein EV401DRAFT_1997266, partial [Pisolithus croceorrhizus]